MIATALAGVSRLISGATVQCTRSRAEGQRIYFGNHASHWTSSSSGQHSRRTAPVGTACRRQDYWEQSPVRRYLAGQVFHAVLIERGTPGSTTSRGGACGGRGHGG
jgi:hypothetical protein